jgi:hypothetical protein
MSISVLPAAAAGLTESSSIALAAQVNMAAVNTPLIDTAIPTAYVEVRAGDSAPPMVLIHGF